jgi:hypothetical protein
VPAQVQFAAPLHAVRCTDRRSASITCLVHARLCFPGRVTPEPAVRPAPSPSIPRPGARAAPARSCCTARWALSRR